MWDYIIIGAGSSGCAIAGQIAEISPDKSILIVEAGGSDRSPLIKVPAGQLRAIPAHDWEYRSEPDPTRFGKSEKWWRGKVLGGSSSINGTMYVRGVPQDYDRWDGALKPSNGPSWAADAVMPIFSEMETSDQPGAARGHSGPLHVRTVRHPHPLTRAFVDAAATAGHEPLADYNGDRQEGVGYAQLSQRGRRRWSSADAFLRPILKRPNVKLVLNALVNAIAFDGRVATGVSFTRGGKKQTERGRHIIVSAGSINTPQLLMLSGIGDPVELMQHGITPRFDLPGVGRNLIEHPLVGFTYKTRVRSFNPTAGVFQALGFAAQYALGREGPLANPFEGAAFLKSSPDQPSADLQLHFLPVGYYVSEKGDYVLQPYPSASVLLNLSYPRSRGRIRLRSADPRDPPKIECRLFEDERDLIALSNGIEKVREIMSAEPIASLIEEEVHPGPTAGSRDEILDYVKHNCGIALHPAGTCRMGVDDLAVLSPDLRVRGTENLWVADASIMPELVSGNTNAACLMIGTKFGRAIAHL